MSSSSSLFTKKIRKFLAHALSCRVDYRDYRLALDSLAATGHWPSTISISPPRSMTTWLFEVLKSVGGLYLPPIKETNVFWNRWNSEGLGYNDFQDCRNASANGLAVCDISPSNALLPPAAIASIRAAFPKLKIVLLLRNPIERTLSHFIFEMIRPGGAGFSLEQINAFDDETWLLVLTGFATLYSPDRLLERWLAHFPPDAIHVCYCEDLQGNEACAKIEMIGHFITGKENHHFEEPGHVNGLDYTGIRIPTKARNFLTLLFYNEINLLDRRIRDLYGVAMPKSWHMEPRTQQVTIHHFNDIGRTLEFVDNAFQVRSSDNAIIMQTAEALTALCGAAMEGAFDIRDEQALEAHFSLANGTRNVPSEVPLDV